MRKSGFSAPGQRFSRVIAMKCAKCGHEVDPASPNCPYCAARGQRKTTGKVRCPKCGSDHIEDEPVDWLQAVGPGCLSTILGLLVWLWLSLCGRTPREHICLDCGHRWGWGTTLFDLLCLLVLILGAVLLSGILLTCLPILAAAAAGVVVLLGVVVFGILLFRMLKG